MADIKFACLECQQALEAPDDMAGMDLECPSCNAQIQIPAQRNAASHPALAKKAAAAETPRGDSAGRKTKCPKCGAGIPMGAVLCVECGFHFKKKKQLQTREGKAAATGGGNNVVVFALIGVIVIAIALIVWQMTSS
ncbi:MAG: hypothetical protein O2923_00870 [Verrucomicrobia bacterium]|nr:hypothetical protein [Verrucomicrobiota bacterium]MDA1086114.1 hypothetical protein [Verrucomicrobiota bacterium]